MPQTAEPLRRDAMRNRERIIAAARELFTERGLDVSLDEIARHAGVGVGTVYRRFADKDELVRTLFTDRVEDAARIAENALAEPDPWLALVTFLEHWVSVMASDAGLRQLLMYSGDHGGGDLCGYARRRFAPLVGALVRRAQAAGQVRADFDTTDVPFITLMLTTAAGYAKDSRPEIWRRYLTLLIDGMRVLRDDVTPLPVPALLPDEMETTMRLASNARASTKR